MKPLLGFILGGLTALASFQALAVDLVRILELAKAQDAQLQIARSQLESRRQDLPQARSGKLPQVNLSANASYIDKGSDNALILPDDTQKVLGYKLSLQQSLYNRQVNARSDAAAAAIAKAEAEYRAAEQDLILRATEAYFNVLSAQDNVEFAEAEKNAISRQLEQAKKRFEVGLIAITDVKEAQASYDAAISREIVARNGLDNALQALQLIIGEPVGEPLARLGERLALKIPSSPEGDWVELALNNNLGIRAAAAALMAANKNRQVARADDDPTLNLIASYGGNRVDSDLSDTLTTDELNVTLAFNMPLYNGGRSRAKTRQAEADYLTAQNNLLLQKRIVAQQANNAWLAVKSGISQVRASKQALASALSALEATEAGFEVGTRTSVDVLNSLRETYRARRDYASARYNFLINTLKLKQAGGILSDQDLADVNRWLQE
jgi:outer membrane protein